MHTHSMSSSSLSLLALLSLSLSLLLHPCVATYRSGATTRIVSSSCMSPIPTRPNKGPGCGIPLNVNPSAFGDNSYSSGTAILTSRRSGLEVSMTLRNLSRSDLVLTAWLIWHNPGDPTVPAIFKVADHVSPCAPYTASFSSGMSRFEPNRLQYVDRRTARLRIRLNFNPTLAGEGALTRFQYAFQKDVPGIQKTALRMYEIPASGGRFIPTSSDFLRVYDPRTGFERLDSRGRPRVVRSPLKARGIAVVAHVDKTTHGIAPGYLGVDHFEVASFKLEPFGKRTVRGR